MRTSQWIPAFERVRKSKGLTTLRHSRESGNPLRRFCKENRADIADDRLQIPAFAGMTKSYSVVIVFLQRRYFSDPAVTIRDARFLHTPFRGNDEVLGKVIVFHGTHFFGDPDHRSEIQPIFSRDLSWNEYAGTTITRLESKRPFVLSMSRNAAGNPPGQAAAEPKTVPKKNPGFMQRSRFVGAEEIPSVVALNEKPGFLVYRDRPGHAHRTSRLCRTAPSIASGP